MDSKTHTIEKVPAAEIKPGDEVSRRKAGPFAKVMETRAGRSAINLVGASMRPRRDTQVWRRRPADQGGEEGKGLAERAAGSAPSPEAMAALNDPARKQQMRADREAAEREQRRRKQRRGTRTKDEGARALAKLATEMDGPKYPIPTKQAAAVAGAHKAGKAPAIDKGKLRRFAASGAGLTKADQEQLVQFATDPKVAPAFKHPAAITDQRQVARVLVALEG